MKSLEEQQNAVPFIETPHWREAYHAPKKETPDFGEPWAHTTFRNCIRDRHNTLRQIEDDLRDRSRVCVNACAGMTDPAAEIAAMREKSRKLERERDEALALAKNYSFRWTDECKSLQSRIAAMREAIREAHEAISSLREAAPHPHPKEHPSLFRASNKADDAIDKLQRFLP